MKKGLLAVLVLVLAGLVWWGARLDTDRGRTARREQPEPAYDFEAEGAVMRQMDASGQLQFEVEAERIVQLSREGGSRASGVTLYHDPPGTAAGSPQRWTLTAREGHLPYDGRVINLSGDVHAEGLPAGLRNRIRLTTDALDFDMDGQTVSVEGEADFTSGGYTFRGRGLTADVESGVVQLESARGRITLAGATGLTGNLIVEDSRNLRYDRDGVLTADQVRITHGASTRITADHARHTQRSGSTSELDLTSQVHIEFRGALLDADSASLAFRRQDLVSVGVKGSPARFSHQPEGYSQRVNGRADAITYDAASSDVTFSGNPSFTNPRGDNVVSEVVVYNVTTGVARLESTHGKIAL
jgi:LPS export ABC transporter protein LptC